MARIDVERQAAAQGLREAHDELERRVRSRTHDLVKVVEELREGIDVLASCSTEIMTVTRELADGANDIAVALSATASTVEEMRQMANVTSRQAAHVSETSERASGMSGRGKTSTGEVVAGMRRIQGDMEGIDASMIRLREQARAIGQIVATVDDLAAQSSVLAVNAAIEAAKAGSHGRGFAMVAREVKSLAQQSKQATRDVRSILVDIQKASRDALAATERGRQTVEEVGAQSVGAGESIDALAGSLAEAVQAATQIAASSRQQLVGADHVVMATARVQQIGGRYAAGTTKLEDAARALDVLGRRLKALVDTRKE
jgi:methyl-accepting chemotaxis protein